MAAALQTSIGVMNILRLVIVVSCIRKDPRRPEIPLLFQVPACFILSFLW